jgi:SAM-dependent methyltransferase
VLDDNELAGLYSPSSDAGFFLAAIGRQKLHWFAHMTEEILVMRQMVAAKTPVVLDFGCNWGKWASMALAHGCDVYGVEVNCGAAAFCAARGIKMISREQVRGMHFDFINVDQVIEHLSDPLGVTNALADALKPGAFMKLGTPDNPRLPQQLRAAQASGDNTVLDAKTIDPLIPLQHVNLFSNASLKFLAGQIGLRPVRLPFWKWVARDSFGICRVSSTETSSLHSSAGGCAEHIFGCKNPADVTRSVKNAAMKKARHRLPMEVDYRQLF